MWLFSLHSASYRQNFINAGAFIETIQVKVIVHQNQQVGSHQIMLELLYTSHILSVATSFLKLSWRA